MARLYNHWEYLEGDSTSAKRTCNSFDRVPTRLEAHLLYRQGTVPRGLPPLSPLHVAAP
jgi:hypothetical protein